MKNRIEKKFKELKSQGKKAFIAFITAGDPSLSMTKKLVLTLGGCGVDIIELGVPFSDPMADGPVIQAASQRALKNKTNLNKILKLVSQIRSQTEIPIALMSYYNPIFHFGINEFVDKAGKHRKDLKKLMACKKDTAEVLKRQYLKRLEASQGLKGAMYEVYRTNSEKSASVGETFEFVKMVDLVALPDSEEFNYSEILRPNPEKVRSVMERVRREAGHDGTGEVEGTEVKVPF